MPSDYDKIRNDNLVEYGRGASRYISLLGLLYPDRTHFIFELLQNAEDAGASSVLFNLFQDRLEVSHDGRCFNELDVRGVCGVGETTKLSEDLTQIGKFGIGFKSVYAYTRTPEVHSGDEHFRIEEYVRPFQAELRTSEDASNTLFIFPLNATDLTAQNACKEIGTRLQSLSLRTLLFLSNIKNIRYKIHTGISGEFRRTQTKMEHGRRVKTTSTSKDQKREENWIVFERLVESPDKAGPSDLRVEAAFKMEVANGRERITAVPDSELVVFFPTESQTRLGFVIQGPYKTTPSRDNIPKEESWNKMLMTETGTLIAECLPFLRDMNLLDVSLLEAMPIRMSNFDKDGFVFPIVEAVRNVLKTDELLPAGEGTFVCSKGAKLARSSDLRKLLGQKQMQDLFQTTGTVSWLVPDITQDRTPDLRAYLLNQLGVEEVTPESFARKMPDLFLQKQSDEWLNDFYSFLLKQPALWQQGRGSWDPPGPVRQKRIIRIEGDTHVCPFKLDGSPNVYIGTSTQTGSRNRLQTIKASIADPENSNKFFRQLGIPDLDLVAEVIECILPKYTNNVTLSFDAHCQDIASIILAYSTDSAEKRKRLKDALLETPFVFVENAANKQTGFRKPLDTYIRTELTEIFFSGNALISFASNQYDEKTLQFLRTLGVWDSLTISKRDSDWQGFVSIHQSHGWHKVCVRSFRCCTNAHSVV